MRKRTARAIMAARRSANEAHEILVREYSKLNEQGEVSNITDDILWTLNHIDQGISEGLEHHIPDVLATIEEE